MRTGRILCLVLLFPLLTTFARDLQEVYPRGTVDMLDKLDADAVEKIELLKLDWYKQIIDERDPSLARRVYCEGPVGPDGHREQLAALLKLIRNAPPFKNPGARYEPSSSDYVMIVHPKHGMPFEIWFSSLLREPFDGRYSLELKEALWSIGGSRPAISIIHLKDGKVNRTLHEQPPPPHRGVTASGTLSAALHLTRERGLTLYLKLTATGDYVKPMQERRVEMEDEQTVHYGESTVYKSMDGGTYVVLVQQK